MEDAVDSWLKSRDSDEDSDDGRLSSGTIVGAYRIESFLGKGGFAEVYSAKASNGERVAIKILHRLDEQSRMRFERESNILSQIHHPNIPKLLSFGSCGNRPYLVTEMLQAKELPHSDVGVAKFEAKTAGGGLPKSLWETYSSFVNTEGGVIMLGARERLGVGLTRRTSEEVYDV